MPSGVILNALLLGKPVIEYFDYRTLNDILKDKLEIFSARIKFIGRYRSEGKLMDIGSAVGIFIESLMRSKSSFDITCCDISKEACEILEKKYEDIEVINRNFTDIDEKNYENRFDVITMWDTIEHLAPINSVVVKIGKFLKPSGIFIFFTPSTASFEWMIAGKQHRQLSPPTHVNLLNEKAIRILLEKIDLKILETLTPNSSLDISYVKN
jgi:2-polyprenyl-3-methyl-5-hydroxy-6-metoxy-1,4-benzoquinol methylase